MDLLASSGSTVPAAAAAGAGKAIGTWICCISGHPNRELVPPGWCHRVASIIRHDGGFLTPSGSSMGGLSLGVLQDCIFGRKHHGGALAIGGSFWPKLDF